MREQHRYCLNWTKANETKWPTQGSRHSRLDGCAQARCKTGTRARAQNRYALLGDARRKISRPRQTPENCNKIAASGFSLAPLRTFPLPAPRLPLPVHRSRPHGVCAIEPGRPEYSRPARQSAVASSVPPWVAPHHVQVVSNATLLDLTLAPDPGPRTQVAHTHNTAGALLNLADRNIHGPQDKALWPHQIHLGWHRGAFRL